MLTLSWLLLSLSQPLSKSLSCSHSFSLSPLRLISGGTSFWVGSTRLSTSCRSATRSCCSWSARSSTSGPRRSVGHMTTSQRLAPPTRPGHTGAAAEKLDCSIVTTSSVFPLSFLLTHLTPFHPSVHLSFLHLILSFPSLHAGQAAP